VIPLRRLAGALALLVAAPLASACYVIHFGNPDSTLVQALPPDVPRALWQDGPPRVAVVLAGVYRAAGDGSLVPDENASDTWARRLRKAKVFREVAGPDVAATPEAPAHVRVEIRYREDLHDASNLARAAIAPGLTGYRIDLEATTTLTLELPDAEEPRVYQARTALTRLYYRSQRRDVSRRLLYRQVEETNFLAIVHQLRAEPLLFDTPAAPADEALATEP
jgi:hypothetical protein